MADQVINWVNGRNQVLPVKFVSKKENPALGLDPALVKKNIDIMSRTSNHIDLSKATDAFVFRDMANKKHISGMLDMKNGNSYAFESTSDNEKVGIGQVLNNMGRHIHSLAFAGKAPVKAPVKQPLSLMA